MLSFSTLLNSFMAQHCCRNGASLQSRFMVQFDILVMYIYLLVVLPPQLLFGFWQVPIFHTVVPCHRNLRGGGPYPVDVAVSPLRAPRRTPGPAPLGGAVGVRTARVAAAAGLVLPVRHLPRAFWPPAPGMQGGGSREIISRR